MLIDSTYFLHSNMIANSSNEPDPNSKTDKVLELMILKAERDVLSFAFGYAMWEDFKTYIAKGISENTPQNYKDIINGKPYTNDGKKCYWQGLIHPDTKESLLADYVYCLYHTENATQTTESGEMVISSKVGKKVSSIPKITKVWNRFITKLHDGVRANADGYTPEGKPYWMVRGGGRDYYGVNARSGEVSLVQFLLDNKDNYPLLDTNYRRFGEFRNEFGI